MAAARMEGNTQVVAVAGIPLSQRRLKAQAASGGTWVSSAPKLKGDRGAVRKGVKVGDGFSWS